MRVVLPLVSAAKQMSGVQRHAINAAVSLLKSADITRVHLIVGAWQQSVLNVLPMGAFRDPRLDVEFCTAANTMLGRNHWYYSQLPDICRTRSADIAHLAYPMPVHRRAFSAPLVLTLHDLYPYDLPENFGFPKVLFNRAVLLGCLRAVDAVACVSRSTLTRLEAIDQVSFTKALVIPNAVEGSTMIPQVPTTLGTEERFLLCIAQHRRNKNLDLLLRSYLRLLRTKSVPEGTSLVIVGIDGPETASMLHFVRKYGIEERVKLLSGLSEEELQWCYQHCEVLVAPSTIEGFGLPVAEGILAGCRVVCSDIPAHREIGGSDLRFVALERDAEQALADAICEEAVRPKPLPAPLPRLAGDSICRDYLRLYHSLLVDRPASTRQAAITVLHAEEREMKA